MEEGNWFIDSTPVADICCGCCENYDLSSWDADAERAAMEQDTKCDSAITAKSMDTAVVQNSAALSLPNEGIDETVQL